MRLIVAKVLAASGGIKEMKWSGWRQFELVLTRGLAAVLLLTEWQPEPAAFFGWLMVAGVVLGMIVLVGMASGAFDAESGGSGRHQR